MSVGFPCDNHKVELMPGRDSGENIPDASIFPNLIHLVL